MIIKRITKLKLIFLSVITFVSLSFPHCIAIRIYIPRSAIEESTYANLTLASTATLGEFQKYQIETPRYFAQEPFAIHDPYLFKFVPKNLSNEYGTLSEIIKEELQKNPKFQLGSYRYLIRIINFRLYSKDKCFTNETGIDLEINVQNLSTNESILNFKHTDSIRSYVTDCYIIASSIPFFLGWFLYAPYIGFRGNREDQINQIGKIALLEFFDVFQSIFEKELTAKKIKVLLKKGEKSP